MPSGTTRACVTEAARAASFYGRLLAVLRRENSTRCHVFGSWHGEMQVKQYFGAVFTLMFAAKLVGIDVSHSSQSHETNNSRFSRKVCCLRADPLAM